MADLTLSANIDAFLAGGVLKLPDGTAAAPACTFASAPTTGMYIAGGQLAFTQGGFLRAYFSGSGLLNLLSTSLSVDAASSASRSALLLSGSFFSGGDATTTKPHVLIEPTGSTSTGWSTAGTGLGINAAAAFVGNLIDAQLNGVRKFQVRNDGFVRGEGPGMFSDGVTLNLNTSANGLALGNNRNIGWTGQADSFTVQPDLVLGRIGVQNLRLGNVPSATPLAQTLTIGEASLTGGANNNIAGANGTIQSGLGTGTGTASSLIFQTPTTVGAGSAVQTYATRLTLSATLADFSGTIQAGFSGHIIWNSKSRMIAPGDGVIQLTNNATTDFTRLQFGGTTASFPALSRNANAINCVLADASNYADFAAKLITADTGLRVNNPSTPASATAAGSAGTIVWDTGFIYVCTATNTWKRAAIATW